MKGFGQSQKSLIYQTTMLSINEAPLYQRLIVRSFGLEEERDLSDIESRLMHLGFIHGEVVIIKKRAPIFKQPFLVEVRGRLVALSFIEADLIKVEVYV